MDRSIDRTTHRDDTHVRRKEGFTRTTNTLSDGDDDAQFRVDEDDDDDALLKDDEN